MAHTMNAFVMCRIAEVGVMEKPVPVPEPGTAHTVSGAIGERRDML